MGGISKRTSHDDNAGGPFKSVVQNKLRVLYTDVRTASWWANDTLRARNVACGVR